MGDRGHKTKIAKGHLTSDLFSFWGTKDTKLVLKRDKGHKKKNGPGTEGHKTPSRAL